MISFYGTSLNMPIAARRKAGQRVAALPMTLSRNGPHPGSTQEISAFVVAALLMSVN
jgi:hypothetical protein